MTAKADPTGFASEIVSAIISEVELDLADVEEIAERYGLILFRKPTPAELSDPDWWGHAASISADDETIVEIAPMFLDMMPEEAETVAA